MATAKKAGIVDKVTKAIAGIFSSGAKRKPAARTATAKNAAKKASTTVGKVAKKVSTPAKKAAKKVAAKKSVAAKRSTPGTSMDRKLIALSQPHEVRDWCKSMGCTEAQLKDAVAAVGNSAAKVRAHLRERKVGAL
jgi:Protein of unknown function (DUF3606)